jgi:antitoxin (DNA-binding transcriptional repressor) of toxin-antitoxin stability system
LFEELPFIDESPQLGIVSFAASKKIHTTSDFKPASFEHSSTRRSIVEPMTKHVIHVSEAEAASDFTTLIARVRAGAKVIIENGARPVAVLHAAEPVRRSISECIALAKAHEEETGKAPVLDADFAEHVQEIRSHRKPWNPPAWE